jgi:hypothetical protein
LARDSFSAGFVGKTIEKKSHMSFVIALFLLMIILASAGWERELLEIIFNI